MDSDIDTLSLEAAGILLIDCVHKTPVPQESGELYIAIPQLRDGRIETKDARRISLEDFGEWTKKASPQAYDVVLSRRCNPGETAHVPPGLSFAVGQNLVLLRSNGSRIFPPFLRWLVRTPQWWDQVGKFINVGAVFTSLKCADVPKFELPLPPIAEQERLAHILGTLDDKTELNRRMNRTLEAMAQAVFKSWFVDFEPVKAKATAKAAGATPVAIERAAMAAVAGRSIEEAIADEGYFDDLTPSNRASLVQTAALFSDSVHHAEFGKVPEGWKGSTVGEVAERIAMGPFGSRITRDNFVEAGVPVVRGGNLTSGFVDEGFVFLTEEKADELVKSNAFAGDIIFTHRGTIGQVGQIAENPRFKRYVVSQGQMFLRANQEIVSVAYLFHYFISGPGMRFLLSNASQVGVPAIARPSTSLKAVPIPIPPKALTDRFHDLTHPFSAQVIQNINQSRVLGEIRDALLPKLLSGELTVPAAQTQVEEVLT
jgi:type I restriction enzyme, S subunit